MRRSIYFLGVMAVVAIPVFCTAAAPSPRQRLPMDRGWKFSLTDTAGAQNRAFNDSRWRTLNLPHDWSIENAFIADASTGGGGGYLPTGIGWYRKHFFLSKQAAAQRVKIDFDGVYQNSEVWINGHYLGKYPNGYMSFSYGLNPFITAGENIITVKVDNSKQPNTRWYSGSGIYRHVWLTLTSPVHVTQWGTYITTPTVNAVTGVVKIRTRIENNSKAPRTVMLRSVGMDPQGLKAFQAETEIVLAANSTAETEQQVAAPSPALWSIETPHLYTMHTTILERNRVVDEIETPFGIRDIRYDVNKGFFLNGKVVKMNGVCLHHDAGSVGAAVPEAMWVRRLKILKEMGCNAIRTSHNPVAPELLDLCDKMGFLVMDEIFDVWETGKATYDYALYFDEWGQKDLVNFIHRDRNHPSVVLWSAGNEIGEQRQERGDEVLRPLIETFHKEDPTRPVTTGNDNIAADGGAAKLPFLNLLDIVGYNYVDRWHERRELFYSIDRHDHPEWKMIGTESVAIPSVRGTYTVRGARATDSTLVRPANMAAVIRAEQLWKYVSAHDYVIGDFMWTGIDYIGEARWPAKNSSSGVIDLCGFPKDGYYFYQSQWIKKPMIHIAPHWTWPGKEGMVIPVMLYTNCDTVELFLNGKSFGMKAMEFPRQGNSGGWNRYDRPQVNISTADLHLTWDVPYEPGTLKAVGRKNGKIVLNEEIRTTGAPAAIRLTTDTTGLAADSRDVAHVKVEVIDANGYTVPNAGNNIRLTVTGAGKLLGFDNGNPVDHTSMQSASRDVFNGLALAVIQAGEKPGSIVIKAESPSLQSASIGIRAAVPGQEMAGVKSLKR